jgi:hypothetical protein
MTVTIAQHLVREYFDLETHCRLQIGRFPLPPVDSLGSADIVLLITTFFSKDYETQDYYEAVSQYAKMVGVKEEELTLVYPRIRTFITNTLKLLKEKKI